MGKILRSITTDGGIACCVIDSTDAVYTAEQIHKTSAVVTAALGRMLTAASLMGNMLKGPDDSVTLRIDGGGPTGTILVVSDSSGNVRGYCQNPVVEIPLNAKGKLDVAGAVGTDGVFSVIRDMGRPYTGQVPIISGEIAEDITHYYAVSEQIPTVCSLGVLVDTDLTVRAAGGFLVQLLPGADESVIDQLEANIACMSPISAMLDKGLTVEEITKQALNGFAYEKLDETYMAYRCNCSKQRVERALISIGREGLSELAQEAEGTEVGCQFCNQTYRFTPQELQELLKRASR